MVPLFAAATGPRKLKILEPLGLGALPRLAACSARLPRPAADWTGTGEERFAERG